MPASRFSLNVHKTMGEIVQIRQDKKSDDELILSFWWRFFFHPSPVILTKHNIKGAASKRNIRIPFIYPKVKFWVAVKEEVKYNLMRKRLSKL